MAARGHQPVVVVHGGSGPRRELDADCDGELREALRRAVDAGRAPLVDGGSAVAAVESAVVSLENAPCFNAGRGSVLCADGSVRMSAAIMCGRTLEAGAVALVRNARNPISLARAVMGRRQYVLLAGPEADRLAAEHDLGREPDDYFITAEQHRRWARAERRGTEEMPLGTVGAVALDSHGDLAAATSTGGVPGQRPGRISDSAAIGAGTYARNGCCAVSCTGTGEHFIRTAAAYDLVARLCYGDGLLEDAARAVIDRVAAIGGTGGLIAVDGAGRAAMPFNAEVMNRASWEAGDSVRVGA